MPVTVYKSTDGSAPVLNGQAGSLCTVLDAILVNGYGAKAAAGWAIPFTGTNKRVYRAAVGTARHYFRVQDDAPRAAPFNDGCEARIRAFEAMTTVDAGTGPFPTTVQLANGAIVRKSAKVDATAVPWVCVADARTLYFFCLSGDFTGYASFMFGEFYSLKAAPVYNSIIIGRAVETIAATPAPDAAAERLDNLVAVTAAATGHYLPRTEGSDQQSALACGKHGNAAHSATTLVGLLQYPNPSDAGLHLSPVYVHEPLGNAALRGRMRGFWHFLHPVAAPVNDGDTWSGTGPLAGKSFMAIKPTGNGLGLFVMETSDTWETN